MLKGGMDERTRLFGEVTKLVTITIEGEDYQVPEGLELLRCYQYLDFHISFERFCWNATCENCAAFMTYKGKKEERLLSCQRPAEDGMVISRLPEGIVKREK